jgi:cytochrome c553
MNVLSFQNEIKTSCRLALAALSLLGLATTGCLSKSGDATPVQVRVSAATIVTKGAEHAFQTSFYAFARTNCAACHSTMQAPYFAESNIDLAYDAARNPAYINFNDLPFSLYAVRSVESKPSREFC